MRFYQTALKSRHFSRCPFVILGKPYSDDPNLVKFFSLGLQSVLNELHWVLLDFINARHVDLRPGESLHSYALLVVYWLNNLRVFYERIQDIEPNFSDAARAASAILKEEFKNIESARNSFMHFADYLFPAASQRSKTKNLASFGARVENNGIVNIITGYNEGEIFIRNSKGEMKSVSYINVQRNVILSVLRLKGELEKLGCPIDIRGIDFRP